MQIIFDLGNVLIQIDDSRFGYVYHSTCKTNQDYQVFLKAIQTSQDIGLITIKQAMRNKYGKSIISYEEKLIRAWNSIITPHDRMIRFLEYLKNENIQIAILSNIGIIHASLFRAKYPEIFEGCELHLSCEVGVRKPSKLFYQSFLMDHPKFKGCPYVDDLPENLAMGARCGFKPHRFNLDMFDIMTKVEQEKEIDKIKKLVFDRVLRGGPS